MGQCPDCGEWNTLQQEAAASATPFQQKHSLKSGGRTIALSPLNAAVELPPRIPTGFGELDRALGGGLVAGSAVLIGGDPGIGKSTLLLQAAGRMAVAGHGVAYVSGEEAADQVRLRARRLGLADAPVMLAAATSVRDILTTLSAQPPRTLLVIDSIQTMHSDQLEGAPGTVSQVRAAALELIGWAKETGTAVILVGHVTKDGQIAGPRVLEHMVDAVLYFEGEGRHQYRVLRAVKNRFGGTDEIGVFAMEADGLAEVPNPSSMFLTQRDEPVAGAVVFPALEGTRPLLVEMQALTVRLPSGATPRRAVVGWDSARLAMLLAVLESRAGLGFGYSRGGPGCRSGGGGGADFGADGSPRAAGNRGVRRDCTFGRGASGDASIVAVARSRKTRLSRGAGAARHFGRRTVAGSNGCQYWCAR